MSSLVPLQFFLLKLQLQHDGAQLHVKVVRPLELPLIMLANVQGVPGRGETKLQLMSLCNSIET